MLFLPICKPPRRRVTPRDKSRFGAARVTPRDKSRLWGGGLTPRLWKKKTRVREAILGADASYRLPQPERSERPEARIARGATPAGQVALWGGGLTPRLWKKKTRVREAILGADVRLRLPQPERSERPWARIAWGATPAGQVAPMGRRLNAAPVEEKSSRPRGNPRRGRELSFTTARSQRAALGGG